MNNLLKISSILICCVWSTITQAQNPLDSTQKDLFPRLPSESYPIYRNEIRPILSYDHIREADVMWSQMVWREIDLKEKHNQHFINEKNPLSSILVEAAGEGKIDFYHAHNDEFTDKMNPEEIMNTIGSWDTIRFCDDITPDDIWYNGIDVSDIKRYRIKEAWFFDENTSKMQVRIIGLAPIIDRYDGDGNFLNSGPMCWIYYPDLRNILARTEAYNVENDMVPMSWNDIFEARFFSSRILKKSNSRTRHPNDMDKKPKNFHDLLESEKISKEILEIECDLWSY